MSRANKDDDDEWETDPDFSNESTEQEQRFGGARKEGTAMDMSALREEVKAAQENKSKIKYDTALCKSGCARQFLPRSTFVSNVLHIIARH
jgi:hypothetical protein